MCSNAQPCPLSFLSSRNFSTFVVGRTAPQTPLGLLLRPELNYGNLSRMTRTEQYKLVQHALSLPEGYTPRLDSLDQKPGPFRQTINSSVLQAVYQGRVDLLELLYETAADRARQGTGVAFDLREKFFPSRITLLHMSAHDGRTEMSKWLVNKWAEEAERDPGSQTTKEFHADVADGGGQTPLFWTFARGSVSVELARYFVEDCGCDFFRVFPLKPNPGSDVRGCASPFSLAIQLAPGFVEEQLLKKTENCGTRFQFQVMKNDFTGVTVKESQIVAIQDRIDALNAKQAESTQRLEGKAFLANAMQQMREWIRDEKKRKALGPSSAPDSPTTESSPSSSSLPLSLSELRFVSQEDQAGRPNKDRWDGFYYDNIPRSAVELMVGYERKRLLLAPIMIEVQDRLWESLKTRYFTMLFAYMLFGILYAINTGLWPRTSELVGRNIAFSFAPTAGGGLWIGWYFVCNLVLLLLSLSLFLFHFQSIYAGANISWRGKGVKHFIRTLGYNAAAAFRSGSARLDLSILLCFLLVQSLQWSLLCHVPQYRTEIGGCGDVGELDEAKLSALAWFSAGLHLLLGMKILELVSVFEFAGPLLSTLIGMFHDVGKFIILFTIGWCAFTCAMWIVLKDVFPQEVPGGLNGPGGMVEFDSTGKVIFTPEPAYSYSQAMTRVVLWIFLSFDFEIFNHTTLPGSASLGRILFLLFLVIMVLIMLNLMIAMFSNTYSDVVKDGKGAWHIRYSSVLCQLLRMTGDDSELCENYVLSMGVDNNCGIDRKADDRNVELQANKREDNWAETIQTHFQLLHQGVARIRTEVKDLRTTVKKVQSDQVKLDQLTGGQRELGGPTMAMMMAEPAATVAAGDAAASADK
jgi:hypothetical protein